MTTLRQDDKGNYIARMRLPDDVRDEYGRRYGARHEAKFTVRTLCYGRSIQHVFSVSGEASLAGSMCPVDGWRTCRFQ